jgi:hypothetical protein
MLALLVGHPPKMPHLQPAAEGWITRRLREFNTFGPKPYVGTEPQPGLDVYLNPDIFESMVDNVNNSSSAQT